MSEIIEYKCPACGGIIEFDSNTQKMKCPYCDSEFELEALKEYDESLNGPAEDQMNWEQKPEAGWEEEEAEKIKLYVCSSCGGELAADEHTAASSCPFCGNPIVIAGNLSGHLRPDYVIPFKLDKKAAKKALEGFLQGKRLLPKIFKDQNHIDEIKGIYVPYWLFDADAEADIQYKGTRTRFWSDARYDYCERQVYSIVRKGKIGFSHVPVDGSSRMDDALMESIEPFDFSEAVDFQTAYLSGYLADKYDVSEEDSIARANERVKASTAELFRETVSGYEGLSVERSTMQLKNSKAVYALYPVWILNTSWKGQTYTFAMNGQTGKFIGDLPLDKSAYWSLFGKVTAIASVTIYLLANLIH